MKRICLIIALVLVLITPNLSYAFQIQDYDNAPVGGGLIISPAKTQIIINPGERQTRELEVTNRTGMSVTINLGVEDFTGDADGLVQLLGEEKGPYSLKDFVKIEKNTFNLAHGQKAIVGLNIDIPKDSQPGGLTGAITIMSGPVAGASNSGASGVSVVGKMASIMFVRVAGEAKESLQLDSFFTNKYFYTKPNVDFSIRAKNDGNVFLTPYATVDIYNFLNKKVDSIDISPWFVLAGFSRTRTVSWSKDLVFGRYTAKVTFNRGYGGLSDEKTVNFWIVPLRFLAISLSVILILSLFIYWFSSKFELKKK